MSVPRAHLSPAARLCAALGFVTWVAMPGAATKVPAGDPLVHDVRPGAGVTTTRMLSAYLPGLAKTPGDTKVYVLEGGEPGGTAVVLGGTHGNEIAGIVAATVLVERARVAKGRLIVVPNANNSAVSDTDPQRPGPEWVTVQTASGARRFKYGARRTDPNHQGAPDPPKYQHPVSTESIDGNEVRNLDRAYPGDPDGPLTQRIAAAILRLVKDERADLVFDLHEAGPESRLAWMIVANPKNVDLGALAVLRLEEQGLSMKLEPSSDTFRGLSHRELGDATPARAFLIETPNPGQVDKPAGVDVADHPQFPLSKRVGAHLATLQAIVDVYNDEASATARLELRDVPTLADMVRDGLGKFLK
jgi:predicted deacylase